MLVGWPIELVSEGVFVKVSVIVLVSFPASPRKVWVVVKTWAGTLGIEGRVRTVNSKRTLSHELSLVNLNVS